MIAETILVTGPTGALGGQMIGTLLQQTTADIIGLVRAPSVEDGMARLVEAVLPFADEAIIKKRVRPLCGDVRNPPWHQDEALREQLIAEVTEIFHLAASTDLAGDFDKLHGVNVGGTSAMLALAQAIHDGGHLRNFAHFSTAFVVGSRNGCRALEEYPIKEPAWANAYEETKYRSEGLVHEAIKEGLPAMVFRPSIVVGETPKRAGSKIGEFSTTPSGNWGAAASA
jgi:thioester reductase-like protein